MGKIFTSVAVPKATAWPGYQLASLNDAVGPSIATLRERIEVAVPGTIITPESASGYLGIPPIELFIFNKMHPS